jgi:Helix-turn-helix domain
MNDLLTEVEAAPLLRLKIKTLQQWRVLRRGPKFVRLGRRIFYPRCEIETYIAKNMVDIEPEHYAER